MKMWASKLVIKSIIQKVMVNVVLDIDFMTLTLNILKLDFFAYSLYSL